MSDISSLYSIGHGRKTMEEFIYELRSFDIQYIVDVRTTPYSKWAAHFNQGVIDKLLSSAGISYVYMGNCIGGRPHSGACYDEEGYFDYRKMAEEPDFQAGLQKLVNAYRNECRVAVMCSESDPALCHRSKLIGRELYFAHSIQMSHIIGVAKSVSQEEIMQKLSKNSWTPGMTLFGFCEPPYFKSRKSYKSISEKKEAFISYL